MISLFYPHKKVMANILMYSKVFFLIIIMVGCNTLPEDLQGRRDNANAKIIELSNLDNNATSEDYDKLLNEYIALKDDIVSYTNECNRRGITKNNDVLIKELEAKISKYENLIAEQTKKSEEEKQSTTTCSICGREFTGRGYHEVSESVWELCNEPYQCQICSRQCGMKHTKNWEDIEQSIRNNNNTSEREDIISYIESHTFSYGGNGSVTFTGGVVTVNGGRATLSGEYDKISDKSISYKLQAIYGDFDASNNRGSYGTFYLNPNGTLTQKISDGVSTKTYTLTPE